MINVYDNPAFEIYDGKHEPKAQFRGNVHRVQATFTDQAGRISLLYADVIVAEDIGEIQILSHRGFSSSLEKHDYNTAKKIYEWLVEWEFAVWHELGPEDRELFATKKLDKEFGIE